MNHIIGIGDYTVSDGQLDTIQTHALASCVAVTVYSKAKKAAGMIHVALPECIDEKHAKLKPGYYATTGVPLFFEKMCNDFGCLKSELHIELFGGANSIRENDLFKIGAKNIEAIKNIVAKMGLNYHLTGIGGNISRTIIMDVATGSIKVYTQPIKI